MSNILIWVLTRFDTGLEGIIKAFTKLDKKLDAHIERLKDKEDYYGDMADKLIASAKEAEESRKAVIAEQDRAKRIKDNVNALIK